MKLNNLFYVGALSALALTGCKSNDDNSEWLGSDGIMFTSYIEGLTSRASGSAWDDGDKVGIFMTAGAEEFENREYTASAAGALTPAGSALKWPEGVETADFLAYYPYTASLNGKTYAVDVTNQDDPKAIDLLYSNNATGVANGNAVNLAFKHQLSQIVITVGKDETIASTSGLAITISGMNTKANFDLTDGSLTATDSKANIAMNVNEEGTLAEAIILPTADLNGATMTFTLGSMTFEWPITVQGGQGFEASTKYTYTATLSTVNGQPVVSMGNATIDPWEDEAGGNINVDFEEGEAPQPGGETVLLEETFESSIGKFEIKDVELGTLSYVWKHDATFHYMKASAFVGGAKAAESRLVSPAVEIPNDATNAILTFKHVMGFVLGDEAKDYFTLEVTDNDESSWTPVEIPNYPNEIKSGDWTTEASSGDIDLSAYKGKTIKFAFKYKSTASNAPTWEVYDVKLVANAGSGTVDPDPDPKPEPSEAVYTSNITLPTGTSTDTNKASGGEVNIGSQKYPILKLGTSSAYGSWTTSPITANATSLSFYAVAWNGDTSMLTISIDNGGSFDDDQTSKTIELAGNANLSGNSPFTFTPTDSDYKTFTLKNITASSTITFSTVDGGSDGRAILVGINVK